MKIENEKGERIEGKFFLIDYNDEKKRIGEEALKKIIEKSIKKKFVEEVDWDYYIKIMHKTPYEIVRKIIEKGEMCQKDIVKSLNLSHPNVSDHLNKLLRAQILGIKIHRIDRNIPVRYYYVKTEL